MARALAHIEKIEWKRPIPGADRIELVGVLGWQCIQAKGTVEVGDKAVYIEIDSKVPPAEHFAFLEKRDYKVKTMKMRGVISQGMVMTMGALGLKPDKYEIGADVTKLLGITKIQTEEEKRLNLTEADKREDRIRQRHKKFYASKFGRFLMRHGFTRKIVLALIGGKKYKPLAFPDWIQKTDEVRCENVPFELDNKAPLYAHEKLDGTSTTFGLRRRGGRRFDFAVCSRNARLPSKKQATYFGEDNPYWKWRISTTSNRKCALTPPPTI